MGTVYLTHTNDSGKTLNATIERLADGYFREDDAETFTDALAFADKDIPLSAGSSENLGTYTASVVATTWNDGLYRFRVHDAAQSDKCIAASVFAIKNGYEVTIGEESVAHDIYHADIQLDIDTTNSQDEYTIIWFKNGTRVASGIGSPTIQVVKRSDGTNLIASTAMTEIGTTELYKYDATLTARQTAGEAYVVIVTASIAGATREWSRVLGRDN